MTNDDPKCPFCGGPAYTGHHLIPRQARKLMGWDTRKYRSFLYYKIPMCLKHHRILNDLLAPLIWIIKELRDPNISVAMITEMERVMSKYGGLTVDQTDVEE